MDAHDLRFAEQAAGYLLDNGLTPASVVEALETQVGVSHDVAHDIVVRLAGVPTA